MTQVMLQILYPLLRTGLAALLIAAGAAKLADTRSFSTTLVGLGIPVQRRQLLRGLALGFPVIEVGLGLAAVSGLWPEAINIAMLALTALFTIVVLFALRKKLQVACRCFGMLSDSQFSPKGLVRSLLLTVVAAVMCVSGNIYATYIPRVVAIPDRLLLVAGFVLFAFAAAEAAKTVALLKERMS